MSEDRPDSQLEHEGIPDHERPLPPKVRAGDQQDGMIPPGDEPRGADEFGTTAAEQVRGESLADLLEEEEPAEEDAMPVVGDGEEASA